MVAVLILFILGILFPLTVRIVAEYANNAAHSKED